MIYFLDTNICVYYLNNSNAHVKEQLNSMPIKDIKIPSMVAAELLYGAEKSVKREYNLKLFKSFLSIYEIIDFNEKAAEHYAEIRAELERKGKSIGGNDIIIASTALANEGIVVTNNTDEFSRINNLKIENWTI